MAGTGGGQQAAHLLAVGETSKRTVAAENKKGPDGDGLPLSLTHAHDRGTYDQREAADMA